MDANVSTMTMPKTMPVQNLLRYISFKSITSLNCNLTSIQFVFSRGDSALWYVYHLENDRVTLAESFSSECCLKVKERLLLNYNTKAGFSNSLSKKS